MDFFKSTPSTEMVRIESDPPGAEAKTTSGQSCRTPCELGVQPGNDTSVSLALNGYQPKTIALQPESGDSGKLGPNPLYVELQAAPPAAAKKKKKVAAKPAKKPPATATASVAAPTTTESVPTPAPAAAVPEPAPMPSAAYPWPATR